jgi:hypothetical protein
LSFRFGAAESLNYTRGVSFRPFLSLRGPLMNARFCLVIALLSLTPSSLATAQSPSLDTLLILPVNPSTATNVVAQVGGIVNTSGGPIIRTESRRFANDIRLDVLIDELPVLAPPQMNPWSDFESFGMLPAGTYNVTARLFWDYRSGPASSFPDPWTFPDSYGQPLRPGSNGMLTTAFTVIPEPFGFAIIAQAAICGAALLRRRR